ncbi:MAG TPA: TolC family protein [Candidatus Kapabacteria bacterium]|nr:TolC family protein [Candidatus Kapabacteria bacterium]
MKFRFLFAALAALLTTTIATAPQVYAQAPSQSTPAFSNLPPTITLADAIHRAIAENYTVRNAGNLVERNDIEVTRSKDNAWLPTASAGGSWRYDYSLEPVSQRTLSVLQSTQGVVQTASGDSLLVRGAALNAPITQVITPAGSHSLNWDATAFYNIFHGGSDVARINAAQSSFGAATNTFTWTRQQIAFIVTSDYLNVLRTDELVRAADSTLAEGIAQLRLVQGQYQAGVVPIGNVYQQQAVVSGDSLSLIQARNNYQNAEATVLFDLNVPPSEFQNYSFNADGIDTTTTATKRANVDTTLTDSELNDVIDRRPDILAQQQNIQAAQYQIDITRGALLPSLDASGGIGGAGTNTNLTGIQMNNGLNVGLSLTIPIFDAMQNRLLIQEQEVDVENARIALEQDVQTIRNNATQYVNNLKASELALDATQSALTAAEESLRLAAEQLRVGAGTEVNMIIAEAAAETARANRINAQFNWVLAQQQLNYTLGKWNY